MLEALHSKDILYRDIKPENLLLQANGYLKLIDFGLSKMTKDKTYTICGTIEYLAPEIILNKGYGKSVDWWALGILLYEMLVGAPPFLDGNSINLYTKILKGKIKFPEDIDK